jgi:hypothetical protein
VCLCAAQSSILSDASTDTNSKAGSPMTYGNLSNGTPAKFSPLLNTSGRPIKFTVERFQQIRNLVERGTSREDIAKILDVTVGSLQVTCSKVGISLRRPKLDNGVRSPRQRNPISSKNAIIMHHASDHDGSVSLQPTEKQSLENPQVGPLEAGSASIAIRFQYKGMERTTELPLSLDMFAQLAWEAEFRNMRTAELIGELIMGMVKNDLLPAVLGKS